MKGIFNNTVTFENDQDSFKNFKKLLKIELSNNQINNLPDSIFNLKSLQSLYIANNPLKNFGKMFSKLKDLKILKLDNLKVINQNELISLPSKVCILHILRLGLNDMPFDISNCNIEELIFSGVPWFDNDILAGTATRTSRRADDTFSKNVLISNLKAVFDSNESLKIYENFDVQKRGSLSSDELNKLNAFLFKRFPRIGSTDKHLNCGGIPKQIFDQKLSLKLLDLSYQAIKFIPDDIENLEVLERLILNNCILMENISSKLGSLKFLRELSLINCLSLKTPPPEIIRRGFKSIISYLKRLSLGSILCKKTKLMLVGLGEAGKTSLLNALTNGTNERPMLTDGIEIKDWTIDLDDKSQVN